MAETAVSEKNLAEPTCKVCGKTLPEHATLMHRFTEKGGLAKKGRGDQSSGGVPASQTAPSAALTGDPVLRVALIRAGIISPADLTAVEEELRASGIINNVRVTRAPRTDPEVGQGGSAE